MENKIPTVFLYAFELIDESKVKQIKDVETPLLLVEYIEDFKENCFWMKIRDIWVLIGKIPPLEMNSGDIVFFKEDNKWGLFKFLKKDENIVFLQDAKGERTTKIQEDILKNLELFGKVLRVQEKV